MSFFDHKIDVSDIPDSVGSEPLPEGHYLMKATNVDPDTPSKSSGADMLTIEFSFVDSAFSSRRPIKDFFVIGNQIHYGKLKRWVSATGIDPNPEVTKDKVKNAEGRHFQAKLIQEEYNGYVNNKVSGYFPADHESTPPPQPAASTGDVNQQAPAQPAAGLQKAEWS